MFFVKEPDAGIDLFTVSRIKNSVKWDSILFFQICLTGKMKVAVPEPVNSLIILLISGGIENTGIFLGNTEFFIQINLHGCLKKQKQIVSASVGAVDLIIIRV